MRRVNCVWAILLNLRVKARLSSSIKIDRIMITSRKISGSRSNRGGGALPNKDRYECVGPSTTFFRGQFLSLGR